MTDDTLRSLLGPVADTLEPPFERDGWRHYSRTVRTEGGDIYQQGIFFGSVMSTNRVPSKAEGRRGTRKAWKRKHPPGWFARALTGDPR